MTSAETEHLYRSLLFDRLQRVLQVRSLDGIIRVDDVMARDVMHNMTHVNGSGVVTDINDRGTTTLDTAETTRMSFICWLSAVQQSRWQQDFVFLDQICTKYRI